MSINPAGGAPISVTVFGGLVSEMAPPDVPEGVSPACHDVVFAPGLVGGRPGLHKVFGTPFPAGGPLGFVPTVTYAKSFLTPTGGILNLYLDSNGSLWVEDVINSPGTYTLLTTTTPGSYAKSCTAFGREFIAISNGKHGTDVPLQYDGLTLTSASLSRVTQDGPGAPPSIANSTIAASVITSLTGAANIGSAVTASPHGLAVGNQFQVTGPPAQPVGGFGVSVVINNEQFPGIATVTTNAAHTLTPGVFVSLTGIYPVSVGATITVIAFTANTGITQVTTGATAHGLQPGAVVRLNGTTNYDGTVTVVSIISPFTFTFTGNGAANTTGSGGQAYIVFPIPDATAPTLYQVISCPTPTTFQVQISYQDAAWGACNVGFSLVGTFYVQSIISPTSFTYQQYGPTTFYAFSSPDNPMITPFGQAAPGQHQLQVHFLTANGYLTKPSPPVQFTANGGQYLSVTNIPIGPSNIVARVLSFTGANGSYFFYIPTTPQVNGQIFGTATQINDNITTSIVLDFSDNTLFAAISVSTPGNEVTNQIVIEGALGFGFYASRLITWGQRNRLQNLLNTGFDGGALPSAPTLPAGWIAVGGGGGALATGHYGQGWQISGAGSLKQSFYQDAYGAPIGTANTLYKVRAWVQTAGATVVFTISSASTGFSTTATLTGTTNGSFSAAIFSAATPAAIPSDMILSLAQGSGTALLDEINIIYTDTPNLDTIMYGSYIDNEEAFDGVSGKFGPSQDTHQIMDFGIVRQTMRILTQDPGGRLHEVNDNAVTEPAGWGPIDETAANCGLLSAFALTKSQADDGSASGGEEWLAWASAAGARIFWGSEAPKISQEIQPDWQGAAAAGASQWSAVPGIGPAFINTAWALNDPYSRVMYFGLPLAGIPQGSPTAIYMLNYRGLNTAADIAATGPIRVGYSGHLLATDHSRKWAPWTLPMNGAALMYRQAGQVQPVFFGGNGTVPGNSAGFGNVYYLDSAKLTDDDYGKIFPLYTLYFLPSHEQEQSLSFTDSKGGRHPIGFGRKMLQYIAAFVAGTGNLTARYYPDSLLNPWPLTNVRLLKANPKFDEEFGAGMTVGNRIAIQFSSSPVTGTDNTFSLQKVSVVLTIAAHLPVRGRSS